jgi:alpha-L-arabinofuranosidase
MAAGPGQDTQAPRTILTAGFDAIVTVRGRHVLRVPYEVIKHLVLEHDDPKAINTLARPREVTPHARGDAMLRDGILTARLPKLSWNVIRLGRSSRQAP